MTKSFKHDIIHNCDYPWNLCIFESINTFINNVKLNSYPAFT